MSLAGRVVIIAGASGGLGQVAAAEFGKRGACLVLVGSRIEKLQALAADLGQPPDRTLIHAANLAHPEAALRLAEATMERFGRIDVLLHLVGGWSGGRTIEELQAGDIEAMLRQHLWTSVHLAQALVPHMRAAGWGRFLVISSPAASQPVAKRAPYAIGKAAQEALVLTLAQELKGSGVTANAVLVSTIDVAGERKRKPDAANLGWTTPEEITATLLHLCSDQAGTINGARIPLHGG